MSKILNIEQAIKIAKRFRKEKKLAVLTGGCFDILHIGHIEFLKKAKDKGDKLFVLLESDKTIQRLKGDGRPINTQEDRAKILECLEFVDYIILLPPFKDEQYKNLINQIKPDIIAATKGDPYKKQKEKQAKLINAKVVNVINRIKNQSTTKLLSLLSENY